MITEINETKEIQERLKLEGKFEVLDKPENIKAMIEMDEIMEEVRRDYIHKSQKSWIEAEKCWIYQNFN